MEISIKLIVLAAAAASSSTSAQITIADTPQCVTQSAVARAIGSLHFAQVMISKKESDITKVDVLLDEGRYSGDPITAFLIRGAMRVVSSPISTKGTSLNFRMDDPKSTARKVSDLADAGIMQVAEAMLLKAEGHERAFNTLSSSLYNAFVMDCGKK